jgi:hypothetical protein
MGCEDISRMPFLVIACGKKGKQKTKNNYARYIRGDLIAPPTCGDVFTYSVNSSMPSSTIALCEVIYEYSEVVSKGFDICYEHMVEKREGKATCLPLGGCQLPKEIDFLNKETNHLKLVASPVHSKAGLCSSQGDIWTAQMYQTDFESVSSKSKKETVILTKTDFQTIANGNEETSRFPVVVKVSSTVIVSPLVSPSDCYEALTLLHKEGVDLDALLCCAKLRHSTQSGLILIMEDLSKQGYQVLRPADQMDDGKYKLPSLWSAFTKLFKGILWKAAEVGCIFSDLRIGFDVTSNVLVNFTGKGNLELQLIDFDSFVEVNNLGEVYNHRYLVPNLSAAAYLFLQVFILGHSYEKEQGNKTSVAGDLSMIARSMFDEKPGNLFPIEAVSLLCDHYKAEFDGTIQAKKNRGDLTLSIVSWRDDNSEHCLNCYGSCSPSSRDDTETILNVMIAIGMVVSTKSFEDQINSKKKIGTPIATIEDQTQSEEMLPVTSILQNMGIEEE